MIFSIVIWETLLLQLQRLHNSENIFWLTKVSYIALQCINIAIDWAKTKCHYVTWKLKTCVFKHDISRVNYKQCGLNWLINFTCASIRSVSIVVWKYFQQTVLTMFSVDISVVESTGTKISALYIWINYHFKSKRLNYHTNTQHLSIVFALRPYSSLILVLLVSHGPYLS